MDCVYKQAVYLCSGNGVSAYRMPQYLNSEGEMSHGGVNILV